MTQSDGIPARGGQANRLTVARWRTVLRERPEAIRESLLRRIKREGLGEFFGDECGGDRFFERVGLLRVSKCVLELSEP